MAKANNSDPVKVPVIPSSLAPDEAVQQLKIIVRDLVNQIVAALTPFVSAGYSRAVKARTEAEALLTGLATADKVKMPKYMNDMYSLLNELYQEGGAGDTGLDGVPVTFPSLIDTGDLSAAKTLQMKGTQLVQTPTTTKPPTTGTPSPAPPLPAGGAKTGTIAPPTSTPSGAKTPVLKKGDYPLLKGNDFPVIGVPFSHPYGTISCPPGSSIQEIGTNSDGTPQWVCQAKLPTVTPSLPSLSPLPSPLPPQLPPVLPSPPLPPLPTPGLPPLPLPPTQPTLGGLSPMPPIPLSSPPLPPSPPLPQGLPPGGSLGSLPPLTPSPSPLPPLPPLPPALARDCPPCLTEYLKASAGWQQTVKTALDLVLAAIQKPTNVTVNLSPSVTRSNGTSIISTFGDSGGPYGEPPLPSSRVTPYVPPSPNEPPEVSSVATIGTINIPNFNSIDVCATYHKWGDQPQSKQAREIIDWLKGLSKGSDTSSVFNDAIALINKIPVAGHALSELISAIVNSFNAAPGMVAQIANYFGKEIGCNIGDSAIPLTAEALIGLASKYASANFDDLAIPFKQWRRALCPQELPSIADANSAYLSDEIDDQLWECWTRANNGLPTPNRIVRDANRSRLTSGDYVSLWLRGLLHEQDLQKRLRELGYTEEKDVSGIKALSVALPGIGDIIRFLVRDVGDTRIVESFGLDESFANKWSEDLAKLAKSQGISDDLAKLYWRAHWDIPSPTQLYTMLHRLRPGRVPGLDPSKIKRPLTKDEQKSRLNSNDLVTTLADVQLALQQDDVAPFWVNRMIAMTYRALTRTDLRSAYVQSSIDRAELIEGLQDFGYDLERSQVLARIYDNMKVRTVMRYPEVQLYIKGTLSKEEITNVLVDEKVEQTIIDRVLRRADLRSKGLFRDKCLNQIVKAYYKGEMSDIQLREALRKLGLTLEHVNRMIPNIQCESAHKDKELALSQVARLYYDGLLRYADLPLRLVRIGYNIDLAKLLADDLKLQKEVRDGKEAERKTRKEREEEQRKNREAEKLAKDKAKKEKAGGKNQPPAPLSPGS